MGPILDNLPAAPHGACTPQYPQNHTIRAPGGAMIEILALVQAVAGLEGVVKASSGLLESIRGKWGGGDDKAKKELKTKLDAMDKAVASVAALAESGQAYVEVRDELHRLRLDVEMLDRYLTLNDGVLRNHLAPEFPSSWLTVEQVLVSMEQNRESSRQVHLNRQQYFDAVDSQTVSSRLADASTAFSQCTAFAKSHDASRLRDSLADMRTPLALADTLLRDTLKSKIFGGLAAVRGDREP